MEFHYLADGKIAFTCHLEHSFGVRQGLLAAGAKEIDI